MNHLTNWADLPDDVWDRCLARTAHHAEHRAWTDAARGRALGMLFFSPSLRTRTSMELAAAHLGAFPTVLTPGAGTWDLETRDGVVMDGARAEHVRDAVGVLSRYVDALGVRAFASLTDAEADRSDATFQSIVAAATVPVVNLESARWHPCQALADAAALAKTLGETAGTRFVLAWAPHPNPLPRAVPNSTVLMAARMGMDVTIARPDGFALDADVMALARAAAARHGGTVAETTDRDAALDGATVVYAKAWSGDAVYTDRPAEAATRAAHADWRVTEADLGRMTDGHFMHCLPVRRGVVVDDAVLDSGRSLHLLEAEYRLHAQKAILEWVWDLVGEPTS